MVELMHLAARLAAAPATPAADARKFLGRALAVWRWLFAFDGGRGMLTDGVLSTGAQPAWCCSATSGAANSSAGAAAIARIQLGRCLRRLFMETRTRAPTGCGGRPG